jgi:methionine aminotransferase
VTFTVNGAIQMAYAEMVNRDPLCEDLSRFYQAKRDTFLRLIAGSRFRPLACSGTYFQLLDYSAITADRDADVALRLTTEHGVASIPTSAFLYGEEPGPVLRFCFAKRDDTLERAAAKLRQV